MHFVDPDRLPETGHPMIDQAHRRLAEIVNDLYDMWRLGDTDGVPRAAHRFLNALRQHFHQEEAVMVEIALASADEHRRAHSAMLDTFEGLVDGIASAPQPPAQLMVDLFSSAEQLVWEHEMVDDQDFWVHFAGRGATPQPLIVENAPAVLGLPALDDEHKALIVLLNELHAALSRGLSPEVLMARVTGLREAADGHFRHEERLMQIAFGGLDHEHVAQHRVLVSEIDRAIEDMAYGRDTAARDLIGPYLQHWLLEHIGSHDRRLVDALTADAAVLPVRD